MSDSSYLELLARHRQDVSTAWMGVARSLRWSPERLAAERQARLRELLAWAAAGSPFYRERLRGIEPDAFTEVDLPSLPILTKSDLMDHFDDLLTDPALSLDLVNRHVETLDEDAYLLDRYRVVSTSGSTGGRGLFAYDWQEWCSFAANATRRQPPPVVDLPSDPTTASFFAANPRHISGSLHAFFHSLPDDASSLLHLPASLPFQEIVDRLNRADPQPMELTGYPSLIGLLALEALAGRLHVVPKRVTTCGEQCGMEIVSVIKQAWGVDVWDYWGCTEGVYAFPCSEATGMHLPDDMVVVEVVDGDGRPVPDGTPGQSILLTVLYKKAQPLIRYQIDDRMIVDRSTCACGCAHSRIVEIRGRSAATFDYPGGRSVHWLGMQSILLAAASVAESQVRQTPTGVQLYVSSRGDPDHVGLQSAFENFLRKSGLTDPEVTVTEVPAAARLWSGKFQQFRPLGAD